jgi:hypothetical protein
MPHRVRWIRSSNSLRLRPRYSWSSSKSSACCLGAQNWTWTVLWPGVRQGIDGRAIVTHRDLDSVEAEDSGAMGINGRATGMVAETWTALRPRNPVRWESMGERQERSQGPGQRCGRWVRHDGNPRERQERSQGPGQHCGRWVRHNRNRWESDRMGPWTVLRPRSLARRDWV